MAALPEGSPARFFVAGSGRVYAVDAITLEPCWELELKTGWFRTGSQFVSLREEADALYALAHGQVHRICKTSGKLLAVGSEMRGLKSGPAVFAGCSGASDGAHDEAAGVADAEGGDGGGDGGD